MRPLPHGGREEGGVGGSGGGPGVAQPAQPAHHHPTGVGHDPTATDGFPLRQVRPLPHGGREEGGVGGSGGGPGVAQPAQPAHHHPTGVGHDPTATDGLPLRQVRPLPHGGREEGGVGGSGGGPGVAQPAQPAHHHPAGVGHDPTATDGLPLRQVRPHPTGGGMGGRGSGARARCRSASPASTPPYSRSLSQCSSTFHEISFKDII